MTQYVQVQNGVVTDVYGGPQSITADKHGYIEIADNDARFVAWQAERASQAAFVAAVRAGVPIASMGTPALDGVYALDRASLNNITAEQVYVATKGTFTNGQATRSWLDQSGAAHTFPSVAEFTAFAESVAQYYDALLAALQRRRSRTEQRGPRPRLRLRCLSFEDRARHVSGRRTRAQARFRGFCS